MMGVVASGIGVGQLIVPPLSNWLISIYGWRISYLTIGSLCMVIIMASTRFLKRDPKQMGLLPDGEGQAEKGISPIKDQGLPLREAIRTRQFWMFCLILLPWIFSLIIVLVHGVIHAIGLGLSPASAANILAIIGVAGIAGRLAFGRLADTIGIKPVLIISLALTVVAFLWLLVAKGMWQLYLFAIIFGIAYGTFETLHSPIIAELFGLGSLGSIFGVVLAIGSIGFVSGPVIAGHIFDVSGSYQTAFVICVVMSFVSLAVALLLPLKRAKYKTA